ncbi:MAG: hypothetical protein J6X34_04630 [Clostridia bacterium]|nr:hypothetical protein [Clostridia bacterium]
MKNKKVLIILALVILTAVGATTVLIAREYSVFSKVRPFDVDDYQEFIDTFPSNEYLGKISGKADAVKKAETLFVKIYGKQVKKERPYQIFYDEKAEAWLVQGSLPSNKKGGVAKIIIENDTGKVLAVWHEK